MVWLFEKNLRNFWGKNAIFPAQSSWGPPLRTTALPDDTCSVQAVNSAHLHTRLHPQRLSAEGIIYDYTHYSDLSWSAHIILTHAGHERCHHCRFRVQVWGTDGPIQSGSEHPLSTERRFTCCPLSLMSQLSVWLAACLSLLEPGQFVCVQRWCRRLVPLQYKTLRTVMVIRCVLPVWPCPLTYVLQIQPHTLVTVPINTLSTSPLFWLRELSELLQYTWPAMCTPTMNSLCEVLRPFPPAALI